MDQFFYIQFRITLKSMSSQCHGHKKIYHCAVTIEKVVFSGVSVCLFTGGSHVTITHESLDLTIQGTPAPLLVTTGGHIERPVQTRSLEDPPHSDP